jgi:putative photosynthetic complex assembly protein 2
MAYLVPAVFALFLWWFTTGAIFFLDSRPLHTFKWSMMGGTVMLGLAVWAVHLTAQQTDSTSAYLAFSAGLIAWGWQELSLYTGYVTGPRKIRCAEGCSGLKHFGHAIAANLWHEIAIIVVAAIIWFIVNDQPNWTGFYTYVTLWGMHLSARLNVFLGVRNVSVEFVPPHMEVLKSFLTEKPMNMLFPVSVTIATIGVICLVGRAADATSDYAITSYSLLAAIMGLALVEHWMLVIPFSVQKLWSWSLPRPTLDLPQRRHPEDHHEFAAVSAHVPAAHDGHNCQSLKSGTR